MGKNEPEKIKEAIYNTGRFHPGKISLQYTVCNNKNCHCHDKVNPKKHGPYYQLSYSVKGKSRTRFIKSGDLDQVTKYLNEYQRIKELLSDLSEAYVEELKSNGW
tara:strand:+ start:269 stop:583 length:315 start_codon:yes stop_codon:yes gene_type:complete